jgi:RNA polymerase sigma factor (sigma-70 family)
MSRRRGTDPLPARVAAVSAGLLSGVRVAETQFGSRPAVGSELLYEHLFHTQFHNMVRLAALLGADDPENVAQEAFVRVHGVLPKLQDQDSVLAYLRRTVVNATRSRHRHLRVVGRRQWELMPIDVESAEDTVVRNDRHRAVLAALGHLNSQQREVLILRFWGRLSVEETAATLGVPPGTVKSTSSRAMRKLAEMLGESR